MDEVKKPITRESPARPGRDQALSPTDIDIAINSFIDSRYEHSSPGRDLLDYRIYHHFTLFWKNTYKGIAVPGPYQVRTALLLKGYRFNPAFPVKWASITMRKR